MAGAVGSKSVPTRTMLRLPLTNLPVPPDTHYMKGPAAILHDWEDAVLADDQIDWNGDTSLSFDEQLRELLNGRNVKPDVRAAERAKAIIDTAIGAQDSCRYFMAQHEHF